MSFSLHYALSIYGLIPESVVQITSVTTMKFATPEKALLDLLYLYPFYNSASEIENLRLDGEILHTSINWEKLTEMLTTCSSTGTAANACFFFPISSHHSLHNNPHSTAPTTLQPCKLPAQILYCNLNQYQTDSAHVCC